MHGRRWVFPTRDLPAGLRYVPIVLWMVLIALGGGLLWGLISWAANSDRSADGGFGALLLGAPFLVAMLPFGWALRWASLLIHGHSEIEIERRRVVLRERSAPFHRKRRFPANAVRALNVVGSGVGEGLRFLENLSVLKIETNLKGRSYHVALGYPSEMVESVAEEVRAALSAGQPDSLPPVGRQQPDLFEEEDEPIPDVELLRQAPPENLKVLEFSPEGDLKFEAPGKGFFKGSHGLGCFAVIWNVFIGLTALIALATVLGLGEPEDAGGEKSGILILLFLVPFLLVGALVFWYSLKLGTTRLTLAADAERLRFDEVWRFGSKSTVLKRSEIDAVDVGPSTISVNDAPVPELKIARSHGKPLGLLRQLSYDELCWVAAILRVRLGLSRDGEPEPEEDERLLDREPDFCVVEPAAGGHRVTVPAKGFFRTNGGLGAVSVVWMAFVFGFLFVLLFVGKSKFWDGLPFYVILSVFFGIGLFVGYVALKRGSNRVVMETGRERLRIDSRSAFHARVWDWPKAEVQSIRVQTTGEAIGNLKVRQLTIRPADGPPIAVLKQLKEDELRWLAALLRRDLEI